MSFSDKNRRRSKWWSFGSHNVPSFKLGMYLSALHLDNIMLRVLNWVWQCRKFSNSRITGFFNTTRHWSILTNVPALHKSYQSWAGCNFLLWLCICQHYKYRNLIISGRNKWLMQFWCQHWLLCLWSMIGVPADVFILYIVGITRARTGRNKVWHDGAHCRIPICYPGCP